MAHSTTARGQTQCTSTLRPGSTTPKQHIQSCHFHQLHINCCDTKRPAPAGPNSEYKAEHTDLLFCDLYARSQHTTTSAQLPQHQRSAQLIKHTRKKAPNAPHRTAKSRWQLDYTACLFAAAREVPAVKFSLQLHLAQLLGCSIQPLAIVRAVHTMPVHVELRTAAAVHAAGTASLATLLQLAVHSSSHI